MTDAIDLRTIVLLTTFVAMTMAITLVFLWRSHPGEKALAIWALGALLVAAGYMGVALREWVSPFVSIPLANACITTGHACFLAGVDRMTGREPPPWAAIAAVGLAILGVLSYFTFVQSSTAIRMAIQFVAIGLLSVMTARRLLAGSDSGLGVPQRAVALLFLCYGLLLLARVALMPFDAPGHNLFAPNAIQLVVFVAMLLFYAALMYSFPALLFAKEIKQRQQSEADLRESRNDFHNTLATTLDGFWNVNAQGRLIDVNQRYAEQSGYRREELLGMSIPDLEANESPEATASHVQRVIETGSDQFETLHRRKDGSLWHVEINTIYLPGNGGRFFAFLRDISERKHAEAELRRSADELEETLLFMRESQAIARVGGWKLNLDTDHLVWTEQVYVLLEHPRDEAPSARHDLQRYFAPEDLPMVEQAFAAAWRTGQRFMLETRMITRSGREFWADLRCTDRVSDVTGDYMVGTFQDISELRRSAERLALAREQRDTLVREVHHRIKNNLQSVAGLLQRELGRFVELDPRLETAISQVHAIAIVHGLQSANPDEAIRLCDSVRSICRTISDLSQRPVLFHIEDDQADFRPVRIDTSEAVSVALVLNELILNAVKHSPPDSAPTVSLGADGKRAQVVIRNALTVTPEFDIDTGEGLGTGLRLILSLLPDRGAQLTYELDTENFMLTRLQLSAPVVAEIALGEPG